MWKSAKSIIICLFLRVYINYYYVEYGKESQGQKSMGKPSTSQMFCSSPI